MARLERDRVAGRGRLPESIGEQLTNVVRENRPEDGSGLRLSLEQSARGVGPVDEFPPLAQNQQRVADVFEGRLDCLVSDLRRHRDRRDHSLDVRVLEAIDRRQLDDRPRSVVRVQPTGDRLGRADGPVADARNHLAYPVAIVGMDETRESRSNEIVGRPAEAVDGRGCVRDRAVGRHDHERNVRVLEVVGSCDPVRARRVEPLTAFPTRVTATGDGVAGSTTSVAPASIAAV